MQRLFQFIWLITLILLLPAHPVLAQKKIRRMTLEEATSLAKERSIQALIAKQQFQVSFWDYKSFRASYLPQLSAEGRLPDYHNTINDPTQSYLPNQYVSYSGQLNLSQQIGLTGGIVSLNSSLSRTDYVSNILPTDYRSAPLSITYSQPIFKFNKFRWDRKMKPIQYDQAKRRYLESIEDINITTTNFFFALLEAQVEKKIAKTNFQNYDTLYKITQGRYQLGKIPQNQLLLYELSLLKARLAIENADLALDDALFNFRSFLRIQDADSIILDPPVNIHYFIVTPVKAIEEAFGNTSPSEEFTRKLLEADMNVNMAKRTGRFDADLFASFGYNQRGGNLHDAYYNPQGQQQVTLSLVVPIIDWGVARGTIKMAESQREIVKNQVEQGLIDFRQGVYREVMKFNMQKNQLEIAAKADTVAKKSYKITQDRYMIGKISDFQELYTAQTEADNSENSFFTALQNYWQRYYGLRKMTLFDFQKNGRLQFNFEDVRPR